MDLPQKYCYVCACMCSADVRSTPLFWGTIDLTNIGMMGLN